ncbi:PEP-CTERM sorting domain-containing protein [Akkermansiaceae bacterium]|nr:PEP-CTERM sorting domain-containing protein [Akkermansiaceae bacterium]
MINKFGLTFCLVPLVGIAGAATSASYDLTTYNFNSSSSGTLFSGGGVSGWSQNVANPEAFGETIPLAYIATTNFGGGSSSSGHVGTQRGNTLGVDTTLTGSLTSLRAGGPDSAQNGTHIYNMVSASFNVAVLDDSTDGFGGRDGFSVALTTGAGAQAATVGFSPNGDDDDKWDVSVGVNGSTSTTGQTIDANSAYRFYIDSLDGATNFSFSAADGSGLTIGLASINSGNASAFTSTLNQVTGIAFTHDPIADDGTSANTLAFDDISVQIPEPSSSLLMVLSAGLIAIRRRR